VHNGDISRLCFYATLLAGSMREIVSYWQALSETAVMGERQRIAYDLHDGVAQELAYLARHLGPGDGRPGEEELGGEALGAEALGRLRAAVQRAQLESRRAVSALAASSADPVEVVLARAAAEVAGRYHVGLHLDLVRGAVISGAREDALVRIACEAVTNVARHSGARQASLTLECHGPLLRLRVSDRGCGFDLASAGHGFGLAAMRQRARSVGGELRVSSIPGQGSEVEATL
jgi:signal transduction histidine kinase